MPAAADLVADIDRRIAAAYRDLGAARARFYESPSGEVVTAYEAAELLLNGLLDVRYALTHGPDVPTPGDGGMQVRMPDAA